MVTFIIESQITQTLTPLRVVIRVFCPLLEDGSDSLLNLNYFHWRHHLGIIIYALDNHQEAIKETIIFTIEKSEIKLMVTR